MTLLECRALTKSFGALLALNRVDLDLHEGDILGVIGPNGAGKTTLFNAIAGLEPPTSGVVRYRGRPISGLPTDAVCRLGVAKTFQIPQLFPRMSVLEHVLVAALFGHGATAPVARRDAEGWLDFVGLGAKIGAAAATLSIYERRRLDLARVLATGADVILLDENMAGLNDKEVEAALGLIRSIRATGKSLIVIEHIMRVITGLADRVIVLNYGEKIAEGPAADVMRDPLVIQAYLGTGHPPGGSA